MSLSPDNYRGVEEDSKKLIHEAEMYINGKSVDDRQIPVFFVGDEMDLCNRLSEHHQRCATAAKNAKDPKIKAKYDELARQLDYYRGEILNKYNGK